MAIRPDPQPSLDAARADKSFFGHPRGLATLFFTEMWERFSYYGMRALLILFMTASAARGGLGFSYAKAGAIYGLYTGMVYLLSLPGGWVADRITGQRRAVLYGGILITCGQFCLVTPSIMTFYVGLVLLVMGTGLLKPNVSTIVGQIYAPGDRRRDSGFSIFYMGINLGALISPFVCGYVGEKIGWHLGFGLAGLGMIAGLIQYTLGGRHLGAAGLHPATPRGSPESRRQKRQAVFAAAGGVALLAIVGALAASGVVEFTAQLISNALGVVLILLTVVIFSCCCWAVDGPPRSGNVRPRSWFCSCLRPCSGSPSSRPDRRSTFSPRAAWTGTCAGSSSRRAGSSWCSRSSSSRSPRYSPGCGSSWGGANPPARPSSLSACSA
jgi:POT family proton-dependent oligopeptide transporter